LGVVAGDALGSISSESIDAFPATEDPPEAIA
jgi:hypothetical protein